MKEVLLIFGICLLLTIILEELSALMIGIRKGFDLTVILFVNVLTNPLVVFTGLMMAEYTNVPRAVYITLLEIAVFITEALIYKKLLYAKKHSPFIVSLVLNCVSFFIGTTIGGLIFKLIL